MYKECVSKQAIARQRGIEEGLLEYMMHKSYDHITVIDLCEKLEIPRKAFYRYFSNKDGALHALIDHALKDALIGFLNRRPEINNNEDIMLQFFNFWLQKHTLLDALARNDLSGVLLQRAVSFTLGNDAAIELLAPLSGSQRAKRYRTTFIISGIISLVIQWHHNHYDKTPEQMAKLAAELLP